MAVSVALSHVTTYRYDRPVTLSPQVVRLRPAPHCRTRILGYDLHVAPAGHFCAWQQDPQANWQARLVFPEPVQELRVAVELTAELSAINPFDFFIDDTAERWPFAYDPALAHALAPYLLAEPGQPALDALAAQVPRARPRSIDLLVALNRQVQERIRYLIRMEPGVQTPEQTLALGSGSCRDSAWLLVQLLRRLGIAARFTSGYLIQLVPDQAPVEGAKGPERDFTDLHAWCEAFIPGAGWIGLDPTSGLLAGEGHLPLASTPDPVGAAPISGSIAFTPRHEGDEPECEFTVQMEVRRLATAPRTTAPFASGEWPAIDACGRAVDARLAAGGVGLTMGGEPTFVLAQEPDAPEWTDAAMGGRKQELARTLAARLRGAFAPGAVLHQGQGKWYPGEPLPRWAYSVLWRGDGAPLWERDDLIAHHARPEGADAATAAGFVAAVARHLGLDPALAAPGYEDAWHLLWRERRLPVNVDPLDNRIEDPLERERLARIWRDGLAAVVGYALPLDHRGGRWVSGPWHLREQRLYLLPGDSPMGYRLPLDSLPWCPPGQHVAEPPLDPSVRRSPLRAPAPVRAQAQHGPVPASGPADEAAAEATVRTALCVQARAGTLHVFLPPLPDAAAWLDLVAAIEAVAAERSCPVALEGYLPPSDARLRLLQVTPDPGVIEVNVHPASTWDEQVAITRTLYAECRALHLIAERFQHDGRHIGTGGGNHLTLGGPTTLDSPFLRRPDLLASLVGYWHNHPALSYLFSGLCIGPTSQAPRADEARTDTVFELQTAIAQVPPGRPAPPWLVDRVFRHLLIDATGNTHRAEFSIDKLYSPDSAGGRRGLVELRGFEMPPHPEMACVQQLLVRALVARFWERPYRTPLVRWGTQLHDRWMLPWAVWEDAVDVVRELREAGIAFDHAWLRPQFEFRFPLLGRRAAQGMELELRMALEPWHVLGEEAGAGGTVRYVDASVERLQVRLSGAVPGRHVVAVNGRPAPLRPTGTEGESLCGVRYRAWRPPSCLHPTIGVHAPLTIDLLDTWSGRAVTGCTYHVAHPGGRAYQLRPINAAEAEARRRERFLDTGLAPAPRILAAAAPDPQFPWTMDLRLG